MPQSKRIFSIIDFLKFAFIWAVLVLAFFLLMVQVVTILVKVFSVVIYRTIFNQILLVWLIVFVSGLVFLFFAMVIKNYCDVHTGKKHHNEG